MLTYPNIDPVAFSFGPIEVHWYGLMYLLGFACAWFLGNHRASRRPDIGLNSDQVSDLIFCSAIGVVLGGRLGYVFFYIPDRLLSDPTVLYRVWEGGMSFHGGLLGVIAALLYFGRSVGKSFFEVSDFIAPLVPLGLAFGRIGNFINGELWGRVTDHPLGVVFPNAGLLPRHPSQLYESLLEGFVLFAVLWLFSAKPRPRMAISGLFLMLYGIFRFVIEFVREPDPQLGYLAFDWLTMGQVLSTPMILVGLTFIVMAYQRKSSSEVSRA